MAVPDIKFVVGGTGNTIRTSVDGITWNGQNLPAGDTGTIVFGGTWCGSLGLYVKALYHASSGPIIRSADGITWQSSVQNFVYIRFVEWILSLDKLIAINNAGSVYHSSDAINWTQVSSVGANTYGLTWSEELGLMVASGNANYIATSPDGITWTTRTPGSGSATNIGFYGGAWSPELSLFVLPASDGSVQTSPDGINWTRRTTPATGLYYDPVWIPSRGVFLATGAGAIVKSSDGINWTSASVSGTFYGVDWSEDLGMAVAAGNSGVILTSSDLVTWTSRVSNAGTAGLYSPTAYTSYEVQSRDLQMLI